MNAPATLVSSLVPQVNLPDLGRITLPNGERVDLRFLDNTAEHAITGTTELVVTAGLALLILTVGWLLSNKLATLTQRTLIRAKLEETFAAFIGSMARYTLFFACVLGAFQLMGVSLVSIMAVFGAIGLAIAFALRNTLSHVAAGIMLVVNRPFKVGDFITMDSHEGTVKRITLFNTEVNTLSNQRVFMPNSKIWENVLINHTYNDVRLLEYRFLLPIETPLEAVRKALMPALQAHPQTLKRPEPLIGYEPPNQGCMVLLLRVAVRMKDYGDINYTLPDVLVQSLIAAKLTPVAPQLRSLTEPTAKVSKRG